MGGLTERQHPCAQKMHHSRVATTPASTEKPRERASMAMQYQTAAWPLLHPATALRSRCARPPRCAHAALTLRACCARPPAAQVGPGAILRVSGVRFLNAAATGDGAAVQLTAPRKALFEGCDFMGNQARRGGAGGCWWLVDGGWWVVMALWPASAASAVRRPSGRRLTALVQLLTTKCQKPCALRPPCTQP